MFRILIAEDNKNQRLLLKAVLQEKGYEVAEAADGEQALDVLDHMRVDLLIADIMMPKLDGYELTRMLRESHNTLPVLMLTAKQLPEEKKQGFLVGTDDYMTKPVDEEEMVLRIKALLRRAQIVTEHRLSVGNVTLDYDALTVTRGTESEELPPKEFYLLYKLLSYPGKIFTRIQLMDEIWGMDNESADNTVNTHINRLRNRFEGWNEFELVTVRGLGYKAVKKA
jgi:Response regulators consisting of a CheY-like receiver domain and a winged-helix DNA-binding domain